MPFLNFRICLLTFLTLTPPVSVPAQTNAPATNSAPATAPATPTPPQVPEGISIVHDIVIGKGGGHDLHAEIAYPKNAITPLPAVIFIHGGGWITGSQKRSPILQLAEAGYFAAAIEYRLSGEAKWPAQIQDCKLGVRWLRANAAQYHVDPNRIGAWGDSAGGHLVACLGTMADVKEYEGDGGYPGVSSAVQAVVDYFGPTDFTNPAVTMPAIKGLAEKLFGSSHEQNPELWKSGSPIFYVKAGDPPMLIIQGDADVTVPPIQSTLFDASLAKSGVPHQLLIVKNAGHGFAPKPGTTIDPSHAGIEKITDDFFAKYLKAP